MTKLVTSPLVLPPLNDQVDRLIRLGILPSNGEDGLRQAVASIAADVPADSLLVIHERVVSASALVRFLSLPAPGRAGLRGERRQGFVVTDLSDIDLFKPTDDAELPESDVYVLAGVDRGDAMQNWSPEEAIVAIRNAGRTPLTLVEGMFWALQVPEVIEPNACFMTIGSRLTKASGGFDSRTPALWISGGTGRDGRDNKGAPKVGWCWWGNRHTWLGIASASSRLAA